MERGSGNACSPAKATGCGAGSVSSVTCGGRYRPQPTGRTRSGARISSSQSHAACPLPPRPPLPPHGHEAGRPQAAPRRAGWTDTSAPAGRVHRSHRGAPPAGAYLIRANTRWHRMAGDSSSGAPGPAEYCGCTRPPSGSAAERGAGLAPTYLRRTLRLAAKLNLPLTLSLTWKIYNTGNDECSYKLHLR